MTNLSTRWLQANLNKKFITQTSNFLRLKLKHNFAGVEHAEMINDYYLVAITSDRLASRRCQARQGYHTLSYGSLCVQYFP